MNLHPTIIESDGKPAFVVLPYNEYLRLTGASGSRPAPRIPADDAIPHEVIELMTTNDWSIIRAWREYLGLTQADVADRLHIRQPSYADMEAPGARPRRSTRERIAAALGVSVEQVSI